MDTSGSIREDDRIEVVEYVSDPLIVLKSVLIISPCNNVNRIWSRHVLEWKVATISIGAWWSSSNPRDPTFAQSFSHLGVGAIATIAIVSELWDDVYDEIVARWRLKWVVHRILQQIIWKPR